MAQSDTPNSSGPAGVRGSPFALPEPELVIVTHADAGVSVGPDGLRADFTDGARLTQALPAGAQFVQTFGLDPLRLRRRVDELPSGGVPDLVSFLSVVGGSGDLTELAEQLLSEESVAGAFVKPPAEPPIAPDAAEAPPFAVASAAADVPPVTPDLNSRQLYLNAAPAGIEARWAWTRPGGGGASVRIIDIEGAWQFTHEDLLANQGGVIGGIPSTDIAWRNHGTAVAGVISGDRNAIGITGIAPDANIRAISIFGGPGSAGAIRLAADSLTAGDIILIELHRPGPRHGFAGRSDQRGYIGVEWWPDDWAAIRYALGRGVIVVEAAGNGAENLDDALYDTPATGFPASWSNPFRGGARDSGAILVGAGAPPPGTHGSSGYGPDRSRLDFSNYGSRVDCQGWGREVTTTGYGDLQGGSTEDIWYTDRFSGTSSASPIVVGAVACYQGISAAAGGRKSPSQIRARLRSTGSPQQDGLSGPATQRIGNRPNIRSMVGFSKWGLKEHKDFVKDKGEKVEFKEFKEFKEHREGDKFKLEKIEKPEIKESKEDKELFERSGGPGRQDVEQAALGRPTGDEQALARLDALEKAVGEISHFISQELRPDLGAGALAYGEFYGEPTEQAGDATGEKDTER